MGDGSPINNGGHNDDDLDFEKELLDATSQSFLNQSGILEQSRLAGNSQVNVPPPAPPKPAPLSFAEQIALASQNLKKKDDAPKKSATTLPPPNNKKEETKAAGA